MSTGINKLLYSVFCILLVGCSSKQYPTYIPPMDSHVGSLYIESIDQTSSGYLIQYKITPESSIEPYVSDNMFDVCYDVYVEAVAYDNENDRKELTVVENYINLDFSKEGEYILSVLDDNSEYYERIELVFTYIDVDARFQYTMESTYFF